MAEGDGLLNRLLDALQSSQLLQDQPLTTQVRDEINRVLASCLARLGQSCPDLVVIAAAWPTLAEPIKAGILAMIRAVTRA